MPFFLFCKHKNFMKGFHIRMCYLGNSNQRAWKIAICICLQNKLFLIPSEPRAVISIKTCGLMVHQRVDMLSMWLPKVLRLQSIFKWKSFSFISSMEVIHFFSGDYSILQWRSFGSSLRVIQFFNFLYPASVHVCLLTVKTAPDTGLTLGPQSCTIMKGHGVEGLVNYLTTPFP